MPQPGFVRGAAIGAAGGFVLGAIFAGLSLSGQHKDVLPQSAIENVSIAGNSTSASNETGATENSPPDHFYIEERRGTYGYAAAVSPNELAAGNASANVTFYRFLGVVGDTYKLEQVVGVPPSFVFLSCHKPCRVIDADMYSGSSEDHQTVVFDPRTIAGEAFTDAFNGRLKAYDTNGRPLQNSQELSGDGTDSTISNATADKLPDK